MSYSSLATYHRLTTNHGSREGYDIKGFAIHCFVGQVTAKRGVDYFYETDRDASANYVIGYDGQIGCSVDDEYRAWTTSNGIDKQLITIEVASDTVHPYKVTNEAYASLIDLLVDRCKAYNIPQLMWKEDKAAALRWDLSEQNLVVHRWYDNKACVPVDSEVLTKEGWKRIGDIEIGDEIACADLENLRITFEEVYDKVAVKQQDTYTNHGLTATKDHRMVFRTHDGPWRVETYNRLLADGNKIFIPMAGQQRFDGIEMSDDMIRFLVAVQADGHYMHEKKSGGDECFYGIEFHFKKERKIERIKDILNNLGFEYKISNVNDGTTKIRLYGKDYVDMCEEYLDGKRFTWKFLDLSPEQAEVFLEEVIQWDGSEENHSYFSRDKQNLDVVSAVASINNVGPYQRGDTVSFNIPYMTLLPETKRNPKQHGKPITDVTCVTVKTGLFLMRQNGRTFIVGNCPGDYLYNLHYQIAEQVNARLSGSIPDPAPTPVIPTTPEYTSVSAPIIYNGMEGNAVEKLQAMLQEEGYDLEWCGGNDGIFGDGTEEAVVAYQTDNGLEVDGVVGQETWGHLLRM